jgi:hypothetical protein
MTLNNPKISPETPNQLKLISIILRKSNVKEHLSGHLIIKWNPLKPGTTLCR